MPSQQPPLGSLAIQAPSLAPKTVHVSPATCHELSLFKGLTFPIYLQTCSEVLVFRPRWLLLIIDLLKEYRRLDDTITMRLNRTTAQFRDRNRLGQGGRGNVEDQACAQIWRELIGMCASELKTLGSKWLY